MPIWTLGYSQDVICLSFWTPHKSGPNDLRRNPIIWGVYFCLTLITCFKFLLVHKPLECF